MKEVTAITLSCFICAYLVIFMTGCMQVVGAKSIDLWGAKFENNSGFEVKAGVMQYDHALERKGINIEKKDNTDRETY
jgi:hypothetical protein